MNALGTTTLNTERLVLRRHEIADAKAIFDNWATDTKTCRFYSWEPHSDLTVTRDLLNRWVSEYDNPLCFHWSIAVKEGNVPIGTVFFSDINVEGDSAVINYLLGSGWWGRGYAAEAVQRVLEYGFRQLKLSRVYAHHHVENPASGAVLRKCGFSYSKTTFRDYPDSPSLNGDYAHYAISSN